MQLADAAETASVTPLSGGVSCDVYLVVLPGRRLCVKRALPRLRVAADWRAPVERAHNEVLWLRYAASVLPGSVPTVLGEDNEQNAFAMTFLDPEHHPVWKTLMLSGTVEPEFAAAVGRALAIFHGASAGNSQIADRFGTQKLFFALRLDPYLLHAARAHPDCAPAIEALAGSIGRSRIALMHGDVSPKNILRGPEGPVFLDAETAAFGDPAFDVAFCLNHLLLKSLFLPGQAGLLQQSWLAFRDAYLAGVRWEPREALALRTARTLGALLLARIDGKSPVEYLAEEGDRDFVREAARSYLGQSVLTLDELFGDWGRQLAGR